MSGVRGFLFLGKSHAIGCEGGAPSYATGVRMCGDGARGLKARVEWGTPTRRSREHESVPHSRSCEHCGYDLAGLARADGTVRCPECGGTCVPGAIPRSFERAWAFTVLPTCAGIVL